jgi:hypothetical protein
MVSYVVGVIVGAYVIVDVNYYIRTVLTYVYAKLFRKRISITSPSEIYGKYTTFISIIIYMVLKMIIFQDLFCLMTVTACAHI